MKTLFTLVSKVSALVRDNDQTKEQVKVLQQEMEQLSRQVALLAFDLQRVSENELHEREKMALRFENELLKFERRLPPAANAAGDAT